MSNRTRFALQQLGILIAVTIVTGAAWADEDRHARRTLLLPKYQQECGDCHIAFPPGMLPAASWKELMNNLPRHYGNDASLDADTAQQLSHWLAANAGRHEVPPEHRITRSPWFQHEHAEVAAATWKLPAVKNAANCAACHTHADQGSFRERDIRIPRQ